MIIGKLIVGGLKATRKVFSGKAGKVALRIGVGVGAGVACFGGGKIISSNKKLKKAKEIQDQAIRDHDASLKETEKVLAELTNQEICAKNGFDRFLELTKKINRCPTIRDFNSKFQLPSISLSQVKELSNNFDIALNAIGGSGAGGLAGIAFCGVSIGALSFVALGGGIALCVKGIKLSKQAANSVKEAKQIKKEVDDIIQYYNALQAASNKLERSFEKVNAIYQKKLDKLERVVTKKSDYQLFSDKEKQLVKNCFILTYLLVDMCGTNLAVKNGSKEVANNIEISKACEKADDVLNEIQRGRFSRTFA